MDPCGPPWEGEDVQRQLIINYPPPEICPPAKCADQGWNLKRPSNCNWDQIYCSSAIRSYPSGQNVLCSFIFWHIPKEAQLFISTDMICGGLICRTIWSEIWAFSQLWRHHMLWVDGVRDLLGHHFHLLQVHGHLKFALLSSARHPPFPTSIFLPKSGPPWKWHPLAWVGGQHQSQDLEWSPTTK